MLQKLILAGVVATTAIAAPSQAAINLVTNGDFEQVASSLSGTNFEFGASYSGRSNAVTGWTSANSSAYNILFNSAIANTSSASTRYVTGREDLWASTASPTGGNFVALDGDSNVAGKLTQTISGLTIGNVYTLAFNWAAAQIQSRTGDTTEKLQYSLGDTTYNTATLSNPSKGFTGWQSVSQNFTATGTSQVLSFLSIGTPSGLPPVALLDSVSLTAAVPESSTWMMMILGFGAVGCAIRSRKTAFVTA